MNRTEHRTLAVDNGWTLSDDSSDTTDVFVREGSRARLSVIWTGERMTRVFYGTRTAATEIRTPDTAYAEMIEVVTDWTTDDLWG